jgi:hypothetical protein
MNAGLVHRSQTLDLLRGMEQAGAMSPTHLDLSARLDLDVARFEAIARFLGELHDMSRWCIADLMLQAESRFGEAAFQIAAATKRSPGTLANWCRVASRIPPSRRRGELSFSTHAEVAALELGEQRDLLDRAVAEGWSSHEMREAVRERRELSAGERDPCGDVVEEAARDLRASLRVCGLPDVDVAVDVSGAGFSYQVRIP